MSKGPKYPNQQLQSVTFETFFRGRLDAPTRMGDVQREFESRLPDLFVPTVKTGEPLALRPFQLRDTASTRSLAISFNQASFVAFDYPGFESFRDESLEVVERTLEVMGVDELTRVAYVYDNAIEIPARDNGVMPLDLILKLDFPEWMGRDGFAQLDLEWKRPHSTGAVMGKLFQEREGPVPVLRLFLRAEAEPGGARGDLRKQIEATHSLASGMFDSVITDRFRDFLSRTPESRGGTNA